MKPPSFFVAFHPTAVRNTLHNQRKMSLFHDVNFTYQTQHGRVLREDLARKRITRCRPGHLPRDGTTFAPRPASCRSAPVWSCSLPQELENAASLWRASAAKKYPAMRNV